MATSSCVRPLVLAAVATLVAAGAVLAADCDITVDFEAFQVGEVIAGEEPNGSNNPGTGIPGITLSVTNTGGGPHSLLVFDSSNPSGDDLDLGTPNQSCGGPGVGTGGHCDAGLCGTVGPPGQNCQSLGKILIVAENLVDANGDNIVDDPDDEAGGGVITMDFNPPVLFRSVTIIDIDQNESGGDLAQVEVFNGPEQAGATPLQPLGNNSAQTIDFSGTTPITRVVVTMVSSGAVGEFCFDLSVPVERTTWGDIKARHR